MSDFLSNLVIRSFANTASVQPVGVLAYPGPGPKVFEDPGEEFSESVVETPVAGDDFAAEDEPVAPPQAQRPANRSQRREARSEATPASGEQPLELPLTVPGITAPPVAPEPRRTSEPRAREAELKEELKELPSVSSPFVTNTTDSRSTTTEVTPAKSASSPPKRSSEDKTPRDRVAGPVANEKTNKVEKTNEVELKLGTPPSDVGAPSRGVLQRRTTIQPGEDATTAQRASLDSQPSIRRLLKRPGNAVSLSPRISSSSNLERADSRMTQQADPKGPEPRVERPPAPFEQRQQTITSLTTLIPKISTQPFLPLNVRTRPVAPTRDEHDEPAVAPQQETVINVAIGRIEVRATAAPAPKRERHANGPKVMNLDDYLHQRRGAK